MGIKYKYLYYSNVYFILYNYKERYKMIFDRNPIKIFYELAFLSSNMKLRVVFQNILLFNFIDPHHMKNIIIIIRINRIIRKNK